jgi:[ribosomal protein S18]-alanine N-acetyltransferase
MTTTQPLDPKYVSLLWAGPEQAAAVAKLHQELFDPPWDVDSIATLLDHPASTAFLAMIGNPKMPIGFVMAQLAADEAEILSIGVAKPWQRKGIGQRLIEGLARAAKRAEAKRLFLDVAADNDGAMALYHKAGFLGVGLRRGYYERAGAPAVDALTLALKL